MKAHKVQWLHFTGAVDIFVIVWCDVSSGFNVQKILKLVNFWLSYYKKSRWPFFLAHPVCYSKDSHMIVCFACECFSLHHQQFHFTCVLLGESGLAIGSLTPSLHKRTSVTSILSTVSRVNWSNLDALHFSSVCSRRELLGISGMDFYGLDVLLPSNQQLLINRWDCWQKLAWQIMYKILWIQTSN